jgi:hypothetical protein
MLRTNFLKSKGRKMAGRKMFTDLALPEVLLPLI